MIDRVMKKMGLTSAQKAFIKKEKEQEIIGKTNSIWTVVESASEYAIQC
ncbi:MAG: hypothetical protein ACRCZ2_14210 [Fusobacteriaceae bacterium]